MTDAELDELERLLADATGGEWRLGSAFNTPHEYVNADEEACEEDGIVSEAASLGGVVVGTRYCDGLNLALRTDDAQFIVAAHNRMHALIAEMRRLRSDQHAILEHIPDAELEVCRLRAAERLAEAVLAVENAEYSGEGMEDAVSVMHRNAIAYRKAKDASK